MSVIASLKSNKLLSILVVLLALVGFVAVLSHTAHCESGQENCVACKFTSLLWLATLILVLLYFAERIKYGFVHPESIPQTRYLIPSGKRAPPAIS